MSPTEWVRVRDDLTGHHVTIAAGTAARDPKRFGPLKSPAVDGNGRPLPPKYRQQIPQASGKASENPTPPKETA